MINFYHTRKNYKLESIEKKKKENSRSKFKADPKFWQVFVVFGT